MRAVPETDSSEPTPPGGADEEELWPRAAAGDRAAAEELVRRSYRAVFAALCRLCGGDQELAADLTQETYRKAWGAIDRFRGGSRFSTWIYRIAYNTFLNHIRRPRPLVPLDEGRLERLSDPGAGQDAALARRRSGERLRRAVLELPDDLRFAVTARFWGELPLQEIARIQGITGAGVRKRLRRAYRRLADRLPEGS